MANNVATLPPRDGAAEILETVLIKGDLSRLTPEEKVDYYRVVCDSIGLNPLTRPLEYVRLSGKDVLYAKRDCADQLRKLHSVSLAITSAEVVGELYVVTARATLPNGRSDEDMGAVAIVGLRGEALANAMLKATTKAKRRVTLSICGLGFLDETEVAAVQAAQPAATAHQPTARIVRPALAAPAAQEPPPPPPCEPAVPFWQRPSLAVCKPTASVETLIDRLLNAIPKAATIELLERLLAEQPPALIAEAMTHDDFWPPVENARRARWQELMMQAEEAPQGA